MGIRDWWRKHSDWGVWLRLRFLFCGWRVAMRFGYGPIAACRKATLLGWISLRPLTKRDISWGQAVARRLGMMALGFLWSTYAGAAEPKLSVSMLAGGQVSMGTDADTGVSPVVSLRVRTQVADHPAAPKVEIGADFASLPGEAEPSLENLQSFRSLEFRLGLLQQIPRTWIDIYAEGGFATRLPGDLEPRDKTLRWGAAGVRLGRTEAGDISVGLGADQRLDGLYRAVVVIRGGVQLYKLGAKAQMRLQGEAILALRTYDSGARDVVRIGVAVGL